VAIKPYVSWVPSRESLKQSMSQRLHPLRHYVLESDASEVGRWLKKNHRFLLLDDRPLFILRNIANLNFIIARWLNRAEGLFQEIMSLGPSLANFTSGDQKILFSRVRPPDARLFEKYLSDMDADDIHYREQMQQRAERQVWTPKPTIIVP
jgi:hypothetical protein